MAQDYNVVKLFKPQYFSLPNQNLNSNDPTWSPIKVMYFDSFTVSGQDTDFFTFNTWRDTTTIFNNTEDCVEEKGPSWTGRHIYKMNNGFTLFFNWRGDTFFLKTNAVVGEEWKFLSLPDSEYVTAKIDSLVWMNQNGIQDSVKCISLHAFDSLGTVNTSAYLNDVNLRLSKLNGLISTIYFYGLPESGFNPFELNRIDSAPMTTFKEIFEFDVGDEFEYVNECTWILGNQIDPVFTYQKILSKFYSPDSNNVFYHRRFVTTTYVPNTWPPRSQMHSESKEDTIRYDISNSPLYNVYPEQNLYNIDSTTFLNYILQRDTTIYHNRPVYTYITGALGKYAPYDTCFLVNHFEPVHDATSYSPGLGITGIYDNDYSGGGFNCEYNLTWYHKINETWGYYNNLINGLETRILSSYINITPNPVKTSFQVILSHDKIMSLNISDMTGRILKEETIHEVGLIDIESFSSGIYILTLKGKSGNFVKKIIKE